MIPFLRDDSVHFRGSAKKQSTVQAVEGIGPLVIWAKEYLTLVRNQYRDDDDTHLAVVFDIDDTLLRTPRVMSMPSIAIESVCELYHFAQQLGFATYIVTARPDYPENAAWTRRELVKHGITGYRDLFMMPTSAGRTDVHGSEFKCKARQTIVQRDGQTIVLNLGDRWSDLLLYPNGLEKVTTMDRIKAHDPLKRPESIAAGLLASTTPQLSYVGMMPDVAWVGCKLGMLE